MQIYKRIALMGSIANPNVGDEAIVEANLQRIRKMYGNNCKVYIFTKDASYTSLYTNSVGNIVPVDYLHKFTKQCGYDVNIMKDKMEELITFSEEMQNPNIEYISLHNLMKEIDVLHIIGGGYLNSIWPDILYEVLILTRLAKKYNKKYCLTGISISPLKREYIEEVKEIFNGAEIVDFRDHSCMQYDIEKMDNGITTVDDAVYMDDYYNDSNYENYATVVFHYWKNRTDDIRILIKNQVIPLIKRCLQEKRVEYFYILYFAIEDKNLWNSMQISWDKFENKIKYINAFSENCVYAKHLVGNAKFNIGSRYHQAVFSLSSKVPVLSIYYDTYYENKLKSIHEQFHSTEVFSLENINQTIFDEFIESVDKSTFTIQSNSNNIAKLVNEKNRKIAQAYGINEKDKHYLFKKLSGNVSTPKISVIIPIYNMDAYLRESLDSVLSQSIKDIEVICIDDGSTDYSSMILAEYAWQDPRIKVISQSNHGVGFARNKGILNATGEFLFFLDPDDWLPDPDVFTDLYNAAKKNNVLICGGNFREHSANGVIESWEGTLSKYTFYKEGLMAYSDYQFDYGWVRFIYNRDFIIYNNLKIPELTFFEDPVFFVKAMHEAQKFYCLNRCTYCYRTGYKTLQLPYEKVLDLITGLSMNIQFAIEHNYQSLLSLELSRIENDYSEFIVKYLVSSNNIELQKKLDEINQLLYQGENKIEYKMYNRVLERTNYNLFELQKRLEKEKRENEQRLEENQKVFYGSTTWKVGHAILYIPKLVKRVLRGGKS